MPLGSIVIVGHGLKSQWVKSLLITFSAAQSDDTWNIGISECKAQSKTRLLGQRSSSDSFGCSKSIRGLIAQIT